MSIGATTLKNIDHQDILFRPVDRALYQSKQDGRIVQP
jgi:GGDEF domain-containing protein